ncbi:hypothetical protein ACEWY4_015471 [Coilia grayii]|uniref:C2H2-type domain-containing protein n=1 Tax=Coilia grayii TaxID=363190 RepID=A0ABD1JNA4_9TELE
MEHSEVSPVQGTEFQIIEVFSMDNSHFGGSNSVSEVVIDEESGSDVLVVDHDFGLRASVDPEESSGSDAEFHSPVQPVKRRRRAKEEPHLCIVCGKVCMSISGLKVHQKVHMRDTSLDCNICSMTFPSRAAQSAHMLVHNPEKTHECPCCPLRFASDRALQSHYRVRHKGSETAHVPKTKTKAPRVPRPKTPPPLPPPRSLPSPPSRVRRQSSQRKVKPKGRKKRELEHQVPVPQVISVQHMQGQKAKQNQNQKNKDKIRVSKLNRKAFLEATPGEQATYLQQVIQESKATVPAQTSSQGLDRFGVYRCNVCKKGFRELHFLERHMGIHMAARLQKCPLCEETFSSARALNKHASEAHDSGTYTCSICGKNLHKLGSLLNHQLLHEKKGQKGTFMPGKQD